MTKPLSSFDLTNDACYSTVRVIADGERQPDTKIDNLFLQIGSFLSESKKQLHSIKKTISGKRIGIVMNLVHEHHRLLPSTLQNPNGENSLANKINQLDWLFEGFDVDYHLVYVSGTDKWKSEEAFEKVYKNAGSPPNVHLFRLSDYKNIHKVSHNKKGGEMIFGMNVVYQTKKYPNLGKFDYYLFTDADMSLDLGQLGVGLKALQTHSFVIGDRHHKNSILVKNLTRSGSGTPIYRHIQRRIGSYFYDDLNLTDSQCPWKLLHVSTLEKIVGKLTQDDWSLDVDMIGCSMSLGITPYKIPVIAIDSPTESHGKAIGDHIRIFANLYGALKVARKFHLPHDKKMAEILEKRIKTPDDLKKVLKSKPPKEISELPNECLGNPKLISAKQINNFLVTLNLQTFLTDAQNKVFESEFSVDFYNLPCKSVEDYVLF